MTISVDTIFKDVRQQSGVSMIGGLFSPSRYNQAIQLVNLQLFNDYRAKYENGLQLADEIREFIERKGTGTAAMIDLEELNKHIVAGDLPADYAYYISGGAMYTTKPDCDSDTEQHFRQFEMLEHADFEFRISSQLMYPTVDDPICCLEAGQVLVSPIGIPSCTLTYFRLPATPVWGYTIVDTLAVYDSTTSTQFEWPDILAPEIVNRVSRLLSVANQNQWGVQTAFSNKPTA
jgi:hypothetical protein